MIYSQAASLYRVLNQEVHCDEDYNEMQYLAANFFESLHSLENYGLDGVKVDYWEGHTNLVGQDCFFTEKVNSLLKTTLNCKKEHKSLAELAMALNDPKISTFDSQI